MALGKIGDRAAPALALTTAVPFIGTPGADNTAAGRVIGAALVVALPGAADAAPGVAGVALVVAALVAEVADVEVTGAVDAAGGVDEVTVAVIE